MTPELIPANPILEGLAAHAAGPHAEGTAADDGAFERIYREHYTTVVGYLYRRLASVHAAEDLAAETFLAALRSMPRIRRSGVRPEFWLLRTATNAANKHLRDRQRRLRRERDRASPDPPDGEVWTPERTLVRAAVAQLPERFQSVIALHYFASLDVDQVAEVLGCRQGTVKSRLSRGRDMLRRTLELAGGRP